MTRIRQSLILTASAGLLAALTGCTASATRTQPVAEVVPGVAGATVVSARPLLHSTLPGELRPFNDVEVQARVEGFVTRVLVDRGSHVQAGELLAVLEAPDLVARRAAAEQRLAAASAQRQQAEATLARDQGTLERLQGAARAMDGAVAGNDLHIAEEAVAADRADVASRAAAEAATQRDLKAVEAVEGYLHVTAPFHGVIVRRNASPGSLAGPSKPALFELQQLDPLRLVVDVPEAQAAGVQVGQRLQFSVIAAPADQFQATVARIADSLRPATRTMPVELDAPNADHHLAPGMYAQVAWQAQRPYATLFVPSTAVMNNTQNTVVERVRDGVVNWVPVRQGFVNGDQSEVFGDLRAGDVVIRNASEELRPGSRVRLQPN